MPVEQNDNSLKPASFNNQDSELTQFTKERPSTAGGRIFGTVSEELHCSYKPKASKLDLPSGWICKEEIKRLQKELTK